MGAEGIIACPLMDGTPTGELIATSTQTRHLIVPQHRFQAYRLFQRPEIGPAFH
jgi:hypothetical protein